MRRLQGDARYAAVLASFTVQKEALAEVSRLLPMFYWCTRKMKRAEGGSVV